MRFYLALDGTADVTQAKRCERAALVGKACAVCLLPEGKDPDELTVEEIEAIKGDARPVLDEYCDLVAHLVDEDKRAQLDKLRDAVSAWNQQDAGGAADVRAQICGVLGWTVDEYSVWLEGARKDAAGVRPGRAKGSAQDGAAAVEAAGDGSGNETPLKLLGDVPAKLPEISNYDFVKDEAGATVKDEKGKAVVKALDLQVCRNAVHEALGGDICALDTPGAKQPILFVPTEKGIKWLPTSAILRSFCQDRGVVRWNSRQDKSGRLYATWDDVHLSFGFSDRVRRFKAVECFPHVPAMKGHCYVWRPPADYPEPDGRYIVELLKLFDNIPEPHHRAIFAAAIVSPYWGGPPGERCAFAFIADLPGSGKGKAAEAVGKPCGGLLETQMDDKAEERLIQRLLHESGLSLRVVRLDNVKDLVDSSLLEALITWPEINGHKLGFGQASRPNNIVVLLTGNNIRVSPDMARRIFFVKLKKPEKSPLSWNSKYRHLVDDCRDKIVADALAVLRSPAAAVDFEDSSESFGFWAHDVLAKVVAYPAFKPYFGGLGVKEVLRKNDELRVDVDEVREQAEIFKEGLLERVAREVGVVEERDFFGNGAMGKQLVVNRSVLREPIFRTTQKIAEYWREIFEKKQIDWRWVGRRLNEHIEAGRIKGVRRAKDEQQSRRGFEIFPDAFEDYIRACGAVEDSSRQ